jgi:hypothetical protein
MEALECRRYRACIATPSGSTVVRPEQLHRLWKQFRFTDAVGGLIA